MVAERTDPLSGKGSSADALFLSDAGLETELVFKEKVELPEFASFPLLDCDSGIAILTRYYQAFADLAARWGRGLILDTPTWRANGDWGAKLGYGPEDLDRIQHLAVALLERIRSTRTPEGPPIRIGGCLGPRGDGYIARTRMEVDEAGQYHARQARVLAKAGVDLLTGMTLNYAEEAAGMLLAAREAGAPMVLSFTVETDGRLPSGQTLEEAIAQVDEQTKGYASFFMINCAHPDHFAGVLKQGGAWLERLRGVRANASRKSHAELNEATELDAGDPGEFARAMAELARAHPGMRVLGGCCGTGWEHIEALARECRQEPC